MAKLVDALDLGSSDESHGSSSLSTRTTTPFEAAVFQGENLDASSLENELLAQIEPAGLLQHQEEFVRVALATTPSLSSGLDGELAATNVSLSGYLPDNYIPSSCFLSFGS
jgi:hypothetical protein